eukprot:COSAG02_NODE_422_length_22587_cov_10.209089_6_plen_130_part_00
MLSDEIVPPFVQAVAVAPTGETADSGAAADESGAGSIVVVVLVLCCCAGGVLLKIKSKSSDTGGDDKLEDSSQSTPSTGTGRAPPPKPPSRPPNRPVRHSCPGRLLQYAIRHRRRSHPVSRALCGYTVF